MKKLIGIFLVSCLGGAAALGIDQYFNGNEKIQPVVSTPQQGARLVNYAPGMPAEAGVSFVQAAEMSLNAVVHVKSSYEMERMYNQYYYDPFHDFIWGNQPRQPQTQTSFGSGVIISNDGYIVTNNHVIDKADNVEVVLNDKRNFKAEVVGRDPATDLALLKVKEQNLPFIAYGNSDDVKVGEWVLAVGNPFNLTSTVTAGIVSAKGRNIGILGNSPGSAAGSIESFIQTDAAVNRGNSGGALVNTTGHLVGINSAILSPTGSYNGYSFAIPVNIVKKVVADLVEFGEVQRAYIGISIRDVDAALAKEKKLNEMKGVYVNGITEGGAAGEAGIEAGDVITKIADMQVTTVAQLQEQVSKYRPGDKVMVSLVRDNKEKIIPVTLKNRNGTTLLVEKDKILETESTLGAVFEPATNDELNRLNITNGLKIKKLEGGKLRSAGIKEGFIITSIDKKKILSADDVKQAISGKKGGILIEGIYPNGMRAYYGFGL